MAADAQSKFSAIAAEETRRAKEALRVYRPMPNQIPVHESQASELIVSGGKRCLSGDTQIFDPVANTWKRIDQIGSDFHVHAYDQETGMVVIAKATKPFVKGFGELYRVTLSNGESVTTTLDHLMLSYERGWVSVREAVARRLSLVAVQVFARGLSDDARHLQLLQHYSQSPELTHAAILSDTTPQDSRAWEPFVEHCSCEWESRVSENDLGWSLDVASIKQQFPSWSFCLADTNLPEPALVEGGMFGAERRDRHSPLPPGSRDDCLDDSHSCGERFPLASGAYPRLAPSQVCAPQCIPEHRKKDWKASTAAHTRVSSQYDLPAKTDCTYRTEALGDAREFRNPVTDDSLSGRYSRVASQSSQWTAHPEGTCESDPLFQSQTYCIPRSYLEFPHNTIVEQTVAVGQCPIWDISVPGFDNYILAGIIHHNSGKTIAVACEFASRVLGIPIVLPNGKPVPLRFPVSSPKDPLLFWVVGWDVDHIGQTIFHKLFSPGLFRVIKDKLTGQWRVFNEAADDDAKRFAESEPAGPLIPDRFIDTSQGVNGWVWENAGANNFSTVYLKNGAVICAYPSSAKHAKQGDAVSGIWIDEDIQISSHLKEWQDRLTSKGGWLAWSVWPHTKNDALIKLLDRAAEQEGEEKPDIQAFQLVMTQNLYISTENKRKALGRMESEDEIARRDRGDLLLDMLCMYDFYRGLHTIAPYVAGEDMPPPTDARSALRTILTRDGQFPREWTRYLSVDPSHTRTAAGSFVVPPPTIEIDNRSIDVGDVAILEWEIIARKHTAEMLAAEIKKRAEGFHYEAHIMDQQIGKQTRVGEDATVFQKYAGAFESVGLRARLTPQCFVPGCNKPAQRYRAVRSMLERGKHGIPQLLLVEQKTPYTQTEFNTYRKKQLFVNGEDVILDEPANPRKHDAMAMVEYGCAYLEEAFTAGVAYMDPSVYRSKGSPAFHAAMKMLAEFQKKQAPYVHLGPGAAA